MINSDEAVARAFKKAHDKAEAIRVVENKVIQDYIIGFSKSEIKNRNGCTRKYVSRVIECHLNNKGE